MPLEEYLARIITPLLTQPEMAKIATSNDDMGTLLSVVVAPKDMGPLIGKNGETSKAIRHLIRIAGIKQNCRVSVKINEPDGTPYRPRFEEREEINR